ncbi:MAG: hypothetical protein K2I72_00270, partial [Bacilli bacterium]|nr:hypothetical protein [Bacilli bacterium]
VYSFGEQVIKIFHSERKTTIPRISDEGLILLSELNLKCFNTPISMIMDGDRIVGYTELFLENQELNPDHIDFQSIMEDLVILSNAGFQIEDLFYNYMDSHGKVYFTDLTCYKYIPTQVEFLRKKFLQQNMTVMNNFLIGLLLFNAFKKGEKSEYTKIYLANEYRLKHCPDSYFGDLYEKKDALKKF